LASPARAEDAPALWRWSLSLGPSVFAPRFHGLNNALMFDGVDFINKAYQASGALPVNVVGFHRINWGYGGQIELGYQLNDDLRGGIRLGLEDVPTSDSLAFTDVSPASGTSFLGSATTYTVSEKFSLPAVTIGVFLHKVFTFDEEPDLRLYLGGSGFVTTMVGAALSGHIAYVPGGQPNGARNTLDIPYSANLDGQGWGAGGAVGGEFLMTPWLALFLEAGFDWMMIENVEKSGHIGSQEVSAGRLITKAGNPILLDFSATYIRLGIKSGFNPNP
jgi:hypothetical protein